MTSQPIDWSDPEWGGRVHVSSAGDLADEHNHEEEQ